VHKEAIYIHGSVQYHVDDLDWDERKAYVHEVQVDHYTDAITKTDLKILAIDEFKEEGRGYKKSFGDVAVTRVTTGFKKIKFHTHENIGMGRVYLPEQEIQTNALWWEFPDELFGDPYFIESVIGEGIKGIAYTIGRLTPLYIMCDVMDISVVPRLNDPFTHKPTIYVYDKFQGGIGLSKKLFSIDQVILRAVRDHIAACECDSGCPACTGPVLEEGLYGKKSALKILNILWLDE